MWKFLGQKFPREAQLSFEKISKAFLPINGFVYQTAFLQYPFSNREKLDMLACTKKGPISRCLFEILQCPWAPHAIRLAAHFENPTWNDWVRIITNIANWTTIFKHLGYSGLTFHSTTVLELIIFCHFFPYLKPIVVFTGLQEELEAQ